MDPKAIISLIDRYSAQTGLANSTICATVFRNPHLYGRLVKRAEEAERQLATLADYIAQHPAPETPRARASRSSMPLVRRSSAKAVARA